MLRSFKALKKKAQATTQSSKEEAQAVANSKQQTSAVSKQQPAPQAKQPAQPVKEKPSLPLINEQNLQHYYAEPLPSFRDVPPSEKQLLFVQKLHLCSFTFDFSDPTKHVREKEIKRQTLLELVDYANSGQGKFTEAVSEDIIFMLSQNLFRTLPPSRSHDVDNFDPEEEEPTLEPAWPHLQVSPGSITMCQTLQRPAITGKPALELHLLPPSWCTSSDLTTHNSTDLLSRCLYSSARHCISSQSTISSQFQPVESSAIKKMLFISDLVLQASCSRSYVCSGLLPPPVHANAAPS